MAKRGSQPASSSTPEAISVVLSVVANLWAIMRSNDGLTDAYIVKEAGLSKGYLPKLRDGSITDPPYSKLQSIAAACGVSLDVLVSGYAPPPVPLLPAAYFGLRHGLQDAGQVRLLMNLARRLAVETVVQPASEATDLGSPAPIQPEPASGRAAGQQHLATLLSLQAGLLCYYLEQEQFSSLAVRDEFSALKPLYQRLNQPQRHSVRLTATTLADSQQAVKAGFKLRRRIELLSGEVQLLLGTVSKTNAPDRAKRSAKPFAGELNVLTAGQRVIRNLEPVFKLGVSERALEQAAGLGKTYLRSLRIGQVAEPGYADVHQLAMATGLTVTYLVHGNYPDLPFSSDPHLLNPEYFYGTALGLNNQLAIRVLEIIAQLLTAGGKLTVAGLGQHRAAGSDDPYDPLALEVEELWRAYNQLPSTERGLVLGMVGSMAKSRG